MYKYLGQGEPASSLNLVGLVAHFSHQAFINRNKHSALKLYNVCSESGSEKLFTGLYTEKSKLKPLIFFSVVDPRCGSRSWSDIK